ncbi:MAG: hypothetical protein M1834_008851 [Cirrosporium novae-zelandiae]|nr:MAG: hypothetical protein M1834_008851 [Cirrosporium novae-zelandiae]
MLPLISSFASILTLSLSFITATSETECQTYTKPNTTKPYEYNNTIPAYLTLPPTPSLPKALSSGYVATDNSTNIWYSFFGTPLNQSICTGTPPLLFLHGGFANANYFGLQIKDLEDLNITILAIDSRGHGRSTTTDTVINYDKMTDDVLTVLDHFSIPSVSVVGWSDGGIIGLDLAMNASSRLDRLFAFGASYSPSNMLSTIGDSHVFENFLNRTYTEYEEMNPHPNYTQFSTSMNNMWNNLPQWTGTSFAQIPTRTNGSMDAPLVWIVDGANEEAINRTTPIQMHDWVADSGLMFLPRTSHFA